MTDVHNILKTSLPLRSLAFPVGNHCSNGNLSKSSIFCVQQRVIWYMKVDIIPGAHPEQSLFCIFPHLLAGGRSARCEPPVLEVGGSHWAAKSRDCCDRAGWALPGGWYQTRPPLTPKNSGWLCDSVTAPGSKPRKTTTERKRTTRSGPSAMRLTGYD